MAVVVVASRDSHLEFVGVLDLLDLGPECGPDEVWYDIVQILRPVERRAQLVPRPSQLTALSRGVKRPNKPLLRSAAHARLGRLRGRAVRAERPLVRRTDP